MNLSDFRQQIDQIDHEILQLISRRHELIPKIVEYKKKHNLVIYQPEREKELLKDKRKLAKKSGLRPDFVERLFQLIMDDGKKTQEAFRLKKEKLTKLLDHDKLKLRRKKLSVKLPIFEIFKNVYANFDTFFFLESLGKEEELSRYSYIGFDPIHTFQARGSKLWIDKNITKCGNPLNKLKNIIPHDLFKTKGFCGGLVGYLSYESLRYVESLPYFKNNNDFFDFEFGLYLDGLIYNKHTKELEYFYLAKDRSAQIEEIMATNVELIPLKTQLTGTTITDAEYKRGVKVIKNHIKAGNVYQTVLSNRYQFKIEGASLAFYEKLREINPSPFMYFIKFGKREVLGSSPEQVACVKNGSLETYPIAGTRKRGSTKSEDKRLENELKNDEKEKAEHLMLVDMARNDLGRVCKYNSVEVDKLMTVKKYSHVQHLVSYVSGTLKEDVHLLDAVMANMPMGTVSGAPRLEAIRLLNELEPVSRGPYAGAAGYLSLNNECMFTLMIRSLFINGNKAYGQAGAGIVHDSVPEYELKEVEKKMKCIMEGLGI